MFSALMQPRTGFFVVVIGLSVAAAVYAQQQQSLKIDVDLVMVNATVTDSDNRLVTDLKPENFAVFEDKVEQNIRYFSTEVAPLSSSETESGASQRHAKAAWLRSKMRKVEMIKRIGSIVTTKVVTTNANCCNILVHENRELHHDSGVPFMRSGSIQRSGSDSLDGDLRFRILSLSVVRSP